MVMIMIFTMMRMLMEILRMKEQEKDEETTNNKNTSQITLHRYHMLFCCGTLLHLHTITTMLVMDRCPFGKGGQVDYGCCETAS